MDNDLFTITQAVADLSRTVKRMSEVTDLLFGYIARHTTPEELEQIADSIKREAE